jgi:type IV pilus assembly protein PilV
VRADMTRPRRAQQGGFFLVEAMVAILIFALGILGLVAMGGTAVSSQSDAQYRTEASSLADAIAGQIALGINRAGADETARAANKAASLAAYAHQAGGVPCAAAGAATGPGPVLNLLNQAQGLPGANPAYQQIVIDGPGSFNRVEITLCWKTASDLVPRRHTVVTYVN